MRYPVFVSYYHAEDQPYYEQFKRIFVQPGVVTDCSLPQPIAGDNPLRILEIIASQYIASAACILVLCGAHTPLRPYVDWELSAALAQAKGLVGIGLPTLGARPGWAVPGGTGRGPIPARLTDNLHSGFALWSDWPELLADPHRLRTLVRQAVQRPAALIRNGRRLLAANRLADSWPAEEVGG